MFTDTTIIWRSLNNTSHGKEQISARHVYKTVNILMRKIPVPLNGNKKAKIVKKYTKCHTYILNNPVKFEEK